jgi:CRP-like cAMP-binding protein
LDKESQVASLKEVLMSATQISDADASLFSSRFRPAQLDKGDSFISAGETGKQVAFVASGLMRSFYISDSGEEFNKHFFVSGDFVAPLTSLVKREPSPVNIDALEEHTCWQPSS